MRLHEWIAEEKSYFKDEGLEYDFQGQLSSEDAKLHDLGDKVGAYQTFEKGRTCGLSLDSKCSCGLRTEQIIPRCLHRCTRRHICTAGSSLTFSSAHKDLRPFSSCSCTIGYSGI